MDQIGYEIMGGQSPDVNTVDDFRLAERPIDGLSERGDPLSDDRDLMPSLNKPFRDGPEMQLSTTHGRVIIGRHMHYSHWRGRLTRGNERRDERSKLRVAALHTKSSVLNEMERLGPSFLDQ
jgi:hypothetical protein